MQKHVEDAMPDLDVGLVMNEWTDCKALLSGTSNLDSYSFAELTCEVYFKGWEERPTTSF